MNARHTFGASSAGTMVLVDPEVAPLQPAVAVNSGLAPGVAAVLCSFNGVQHRAMVEVGEGNRVRPGDIADALVVLAARVRNG